jgi:UrcA family protein
MSFRLFLAAPALILLAPVAAQANPAIATEFEALVAHDDLDLAKPGDVTRLDERVRTKVRQMCANGGRDGASVRLERECRKTALAATAPAVRVAIANARMKPVRFAQTTPASPAATPGA